MHVAKLAATLQAFVLVARKPVDHSPPECSVVWLFFHIISS